VNSSGGVYTAEGGETGLSILNHPGVIEAQHLAPGGVLATIFGGMYHPGTDAPSRIDHTQTILVDMGTADPHGSGYALDLLGTDGTS
jgi:hypothetical protein